MKKIIFPDKRGSFYSYRSLLNRSHDAEFYQAVCVIPWINGFFITARRINRFQGCVECLIRRLLSTIYHKTAKIDGIDSIWCSKILEQDQAILNLADLTREKPESSTLCYFYNWDLSAPREIHVLPVPACRCANKEGLKLEKNFARQWIQQWPNIILNIAVRSEQLPSFHIIYSELPSTSLLFPLNRLSRFHVSSNPTAAAFRNTPNLYNRLLGESIERYSLKYIPIEKLFIDKALSINLEKEHLNDSGCNIWTEIHDIDGKSIPVKAQRVYGILHRIQPTKYLPLSSSGVAAHTDQQSAKCSALLELLERDALIVAWRLATHSEHSCLTKIPMNFLSRIREESWLRYLLDKQKYCLFILGVNNQFNIPICLTVAVGKEVNDGLIPLFGSGAAFRWEDAIRKALNEILQGLSIPCNNIQVNLPSSFNERPAFWAVNERAKFLRLFLESSKDNFHENSVDSMEKLSIKLKELSQKIYFADLTPPDIALGGWYVVRAIAPHFEPFVSNSSYEKPSLDRVNYYLKSIGYPKIMKINVQPFPFP